MWNKDSEGLEQLEYSENIVDIINHFMHQILYVKYTDGWWCSSKLSYLIPKFLWNMGLPQPTLELKIGAPMTSSKHPNPLTLCSGTREGVKQLYNLTDWSCSDYWPYSKIKPQWLLIIQQEDMYLPEEYLQHHWTTHSNLKDLCFQ